MSEELRELTDEEWEEMGMEDRPLPPDPPMPRVSKRKPRTRLRGPNGERIAKRDVRAIENAGAYGPVIKAEGATRKTEQFPMATVSKACPLTEQQQQEFFTDLRLGVSKQTAFEEMLLRHNLESRYCYKDLLDWEAESDALVRRIAAHRSPGTAALERTARLMAAGKIKTVTKREKRVFGAFHQGVWCPVDDPDGVVAEEVKESKGNAPSMAALELGLRASGRADLTRDRESSERRGTSVQLVFNNAPPPKAAFFVAVGAGRGEEPVVIEANRVEPDDQEGDAE